MACRPDIRIFSILVQSLCHLGPVSFTAQHGETRPHTGPAQYATRKPYLHLTVRYTVRPQGLTDY